MSAQLLQIDLMGIDALDNCHLFSIPALLDFDYNPLLLLGDLLADAKLLGKATAAKSLQLF